MKKINKKTLSFVLASFLILTFVSAGLVTYYGQITQTINVELPVKFTGDETSTIGWYSGETIEGSLLGMENVADFEVLMKISDDSNLEDGIETSYFGELELTKKDISTWTYTTTDAKVTIEYVVAGAEFDAEVIDDVQNNEEYVLVYYADSDNRFANPGQAVLVEGVEDNLPGTNDTNANLNDYSLEYPTTPFGAKIWYMPSTVLDCNGGVVCDIDWTHEDFKDTYFETSLIQYNAEGLITVYPGEKLDFTPEFDVSLLFNGTADITTSVAPIIA